MIRLELPRANIDPNASTEEKVMALESQFDALVNDLYVIFNSIESDTDTFEGGDIISEDVLVTDNETITHASFGYGGKGIAKEGYRAIGVVGGHLKNATNGGTYNTWCYLHSLYLKGNSVNWIVRNTHATTDAVIQIVATILYVKE